MTKMQTEFIQVSTTVADKEHADAIADAIVKERLAACVQVLGPIQSTYWWKGKLQKSEEWLCLAKTTESLYHAIEERIKSIHPYETPEIAAVPIVAGSKEYLSWLSSQVRKP